VAATLSDIEGQALSLPLAERAALAKRLLASLDETDEAENERIWVEEAERRYQEYLKGRVTSRPASEVFHDAFARFR
jgi:putative addiction module component (TIGR02574 family)